MLSSKRRINPYLEKFDEIKSGNKVLKPEVRPALRSAITRCNMNENYLTSSFGLRRDVIKNA